MQIGALNTSNACLRWPSRSVRFVFPCTTMNGTSSQWAAGNLPLARGIAAIFSPGTVAMASSPFGAHFMLDKAAPPIHHAQRKSSLVSLLRSIPLSMSSIFSSRSETSNQALERTADRRKDLLMMTSTLNLEAPLGLVSGRSAPSR
jgi:hypothetical protein